MDYPGDKLLLLEKWVENAAAGNESAEKLAREVLALAAKNCPLPILVQLGRCLIEGHRAELRDQAESN